MKLKKDFITHETNGQQIMVSTGESRFYGMVKANKTAAFIVNCLKTDTDEETITEKLKGRFDGPEDKMRSDVHRIVEQLKGIGAIEE